MSEVNYFSVVERGHAIQNPTSPDKLGLVADYLDLRRGSRLLDVGSGRGWWAVRAASEGCEVMGLEINEDFAAAAGRRAAEAGVEDRVRTVVGPAAEHAPDPGEFDVVTCLGASFALGSYHETLDWMVRAVRPGGRMAIGEVHSTELPPPPDLPDLPALPDLARTAGEFDIDIIGLVSSSVDDWDRYESLHWRNVHDWAAENPEHPQRGEIVTRCQRYRDDYLAHERGRLGWSILVGTVEPDQASQ